VALTTREEKARIFEMALDKVNTDLDVKRQMSRLLKRISSTR
jgi:hypothetical protein